MRTRAHGRRSFWLSAEEQGRQGRQHRHAPLLAILPIPDTESAVHTALLSSLQRSFEQGSCALGSGGRENKTGLLTASPSVSRPVSALATHSLARRMPITKLATATKVIRSEL